MCRYTTLWNISFFQKLHLQYTEMAMADKRTYKEEMVTEVVLSQQDQSQNHCCHKTIVVKWWQLHLVKWYKAIYICYAGK